MPHNNHNAAENLILVSLKYRISYWGWLRLRSWFLYPVSADCGRYTTKRRNIMEEVEYNELDYWGWECPKCGHWNETQDDPGYQETVFCEGEINGNPCNGEFVPVLG